MSSKNLLYLRNTAKFSESIKTWTFRSRKRLLLLEFDRIEVPEYAERSEILHTRLTREIFHQRSIAVQMIRFAITQSDFGGKKGCPNSRGSHSIKVWTVSGRTKYQTLNSSHLKFSSECGECKCQPRMKISTNSENTTQHSTILDTIWVRKNGQPEQYWT